jgi:hypothetical protein
MANFDDERRLLDTYRSKKSDLDANLSELLRQRTALESIIKGLELFIGHHVTERPTGSDPLLIGGEINLNELLKPPDDAELTTLERGIQALRQAAKPMAAAEIKHWLDRHGIPVNYQTLYKALRREAEKPDGHVVRSGDSFAFRVRSVRFPLGRDSK